MFQSLPLKPIIAIEIENGGVLSVSTNVRSLTDAQVVVVNNGEAKRDTLSIDEELDQLLDAAHRDEITVGVSMATALAAEEFLRISRRAYESPERALTDVKDAMCELADILVSLRLD